LAKLALNGGPAEAAGLMGRIPAWPMADREDERALIEVLWNRKWCRLYPGSKVEEFEKAFAAFQDAKHGVAVANGTVALELALKTAGVRIGDEVLVPAVTFIATASAVAEVGAVPVFVDVDPETGGMSAEALENAVTPRSKAVIVVHYGGYPVDLDAILPVAERHGLRLIEDCAHAHGSEWKDRKVGAIGDLGGFSFQESKSLTAGEGGIVLTNSLELGEKARLIHNIGRVVGRPGYEHHVLSSNYRMTEFQAALLLSEMRRLPEQTEAKHEAGEYLAKELRAIGGIEPLRRDPRITKRGYYFFIARYDPEAFNGLPKERFLEALNAEGVPASQGYGMPLYRQPAFRSENLRDILPAPFFSPLGYERLNLPGAEEFSAGEVTIPHTVLLAGKPGMDMIARSIRKIKENVSELM